MTTATGAKTKIVFDPPGPVSHGARVSGRRATAAMSALSEDPPLSLTTASLSADFTGSARVGDWLEARVDVLKVGGRVVFANAHLVVGTERVARVGGVFARNAARPRDDGAAAGEGR